MLWDSVFEQVNTLFCWFFEQDSLWQREEMDIRGKQFKPLQQDSTEYLWLIQEWYQHRVNSVYTVETLFKAEEQLW